MLKNYMKESQKLPLFGVGPYLVLTMAIIYIIGVILFGYVLNIGTMEGVWIIVFRFIGIVLLVIGIYIWYLGAVKSDMDDSITENRLQTKGIYSIVRNPMYSGWWMAFSGIILMWHNAWMLVLPLINCLIITVVLINTEEKWLIDLYGNEYIEYKKHVNRCIPWRRHKSLVK